MREREVDDGKQSVYDFKATPVVTMSFLVFYYPNANRVLRLNIKIITLLNN